MRNSRLLALITSILFCAAIVLPLLFVNLQQDRISSSENRYLENFPSIFDAQGHLARSQFFKIEDWINDNIGFREDAIELNAKINLQLFRCSPNAQVHIGRQGWYYYTPNNNLDIAIGTYPIDEHKLSDIAIAQQKIKDTLSQMGIEYILVLAPSKCSIYPEFIDYSGLSIRDTPIDIVERYLNENTNVTVVNTKPALLNEKSGGHQVYLKTDTHWNEYGAYVAYNCITEAVSNSTGKKIVPNSIQSTSTSFVGDLSRLIGASDISAAEETESITLVDANAVKDDSSEIFRQLTSLYDGTSSYNGIRSFSNNTADGTIMMFGDSFLNNFNINAWIAENYEKTIHVRSPLIQMDAIHLVKPDIIVYEIAERYILSLTTIAL